MVPGVHRIPRITEKVEVTVGGGAVGNERREEEEALGEKGGRCGMVRGVRRIPRITENLNVTVGGGGGRKMERDGPGTVAGRRKPSEKKWGSEEGATGEAGEAKGEGGGGRGRGKTAKGSS